MASSTAIRPSRRPEGYLVDIAALLVCGFGFLVLIILWFDNAQGGLTGNGVFKSMEVHDWTADPAHAPLYPANYFFYPAYGYLCRFLDWIGILPGDPRRQLTILNAAFASICLTFVYALVREMTGDRVIALATAFFHLACNDVLYLAIINEDIMSSYTILFGSMALAGLWFARPTVLRVVIVSVVFTVAWLFEWRLMFPTLPAIAAAFWFAEDRMSRRIGWLALFLAVMVAIAALVAFLTRNHLHAADTWTLLWTGKAVVSAWSGFSWVKAHFLTDGVAAYLTGTRIAEMPDIPGWDLWRWTTISLEVALAVVVLRELWRARDDRRSWSLFAIFGGTLVAGTVFNLYSQPHDPQMQINVMAWMTVGWALGLVAARRRWGSRGISVMVALSVLLMAHNVWCLAPLQGEDGKWMEAVKRLEKKADPRNTVFVIHDFDWASTYTAARWGNAFPLIELLLPAPVGDPLFKRVGFVGGILQHHERTEAEQIGALTWQIDHAFALGYDVVAVRLWDADPGFIDSLTSTIAPLSLIHGLSEALHRDFVATEIMDDPVLGKVYKLKKAPGR